MGSTIHVPETGEGKTIETSRKNAFFMAWIMFFGLCTLGFALYGSTAFSLEWSKPGTSAQGLVPGRYIVVLHEGVRNPATVARRMARAHRFTLRQVYQRALKGFSASLPEWLAQSLEFDPNVAYIEPDRRVYAVGQRMPTGIDRIGWAGASDRLEKDAAVTAVEAPETVVLGNSVAVTVTVRNMGSGNIDGEIEVTLYDETAPDSPIGSDTLTGGLSAGASGMWRSFGTPRKQARGRIPWLPSVPWPET